MPERIFIIYEGGRLFLGGNAVPFKIGDLFSVITAFSKAAVSVLSLGELLFQNLSAQLSR